jgi:adenylate kinase
MNIVLLGSPASGKGTQAEILCRRFNLFHLSTGDVARNLAKTDPRIAEIVNSGKLIPPEEMTMHVLDFLEHQKPDLKDILFEGFPRFISQYEALDNFLKSKGDDIDLVISLDVPMEVAVKRISSRFMCPKCGEVYNTETNPPKKAGVCDKDGTALVQRDDDKPEAVKVRFEYYQKNTKELIDFLDKEGKLVRVDGTRSIDAIASDLIKLVMKVKDNDKNKDR